MTIGRETIEYIEVFSPPLFMVLLSEVLFKFPRSTVVQKQVIFSLTFGQKFNSSLMLSHNAYIIHLTHLITSAFCLLTSSQREEGYIQYNKTL